MAETVLLTGATGFLGSHLCEKLVRDGYKVIILKRKKSDTWRIDSLLSKLDSYNIEETPISQIFESEEVSTVIHTATNYGRNDEKPSVIVESNILFPLRLIEIAVEHNTDTFLNTDTILYEYLNYYSLSKKQFINWLSFYTNKIRVFNLKLEHVYGEKDGTQKFISRVIDSFLCNREQIGLTEGKQIRDFIYVEDVVSAYMKILKKSTTFKKKYFEYSIGSGVPTTINEIVELIKKLNRKNLRFDIKIKDTLEGSISC